MTNIIIVTTLLHLFAIIPLYHNIFYICIINCSTLLSTLWHHYNEKNNIIYYMDYIMALILVIYEIYLSYDIFFHTTIFLNFVVFIVNKYVDRLYNYKLYHSMWHIMSAMKCYYISYYISTYKKNEFY